MNNALFAACGTLVLAGTMTLSAQTPAPTPAPPGWPQATVPAEPAPKPASGPMTMTGCLKTSDSAMGAPPAGAMAKPGAVMPGATVPGTHYMLADAAMDRPLFGGSAPAGAGAPAPAHPMTTHYMLMAGAGVDLAAHVNHQVRITGIVAEAHDGMPGMMPGAKPMPTPAEKPAARPGDAPKSNPSGMDHAGAHKGGSTLTVSSITMISATCTATR